jgi:iron complex outermembrane receptor protein
VDASASTESLGDGNIRLLLGAQYDTYQLNLSSFDVAGVGQDPQRELRSTSGGETDTSAIYAEGTWRLHPLWAVTAGARYESWRASDGYTGDLTLDSRRERGLSPKLSLEYAPQPDWLLRYSLARALRFPIVEELYQNESRTRSLQTANAGLQPEDGLHHNWMVERQLTDGVVRINLFQERVEDTIFNQLGIVDGVEISTFLGIDEVTTRGAEFIFNRRQLWQSPLDLRFNLSFLDARITRNSVNPATEGNRFPRLPRWQSNLLLNYQWSDTLSTSGGARYASNSYGELDNSDTASRTFGAHDAYLIFNLRGQWQVNKNLDLALGVDNLTDQVAYVHHPWPSRTVYLEAGYVF